MTVTDQTIDDLLKLARLEVDAAEHDRLRDDLLRILTFVEAISEVDTDGVEPLVHMTTAGDPLRSDEAHDVLGKAAVQGSAGFTGEYVRVPQVVE